MSDLTLGILSALLATNQPLAVSNLVHEQTGVSLPIVDKSDPTERELRNVMMADDTAIDEVTMWVSTNRLPATDTNGIAILNQKIRDRLDVQKHAYEAFLRNHPDSARGYLAYGSFLNEIGDPEGGKVQYLNSKQIDPKNPAVWNQLAIYYGEFGELTNSFAHFTEAIRLDPTEPVYYQNLATTVYLYRKDAREFYHIEEQQVFDKALGLYKQAMKLAPDNFLLAEDYALSYYGIKPMRTNDALVAWTNALNIAHDENEREGIEIHLARTKIAAGYYEQASNHLAKVTNAALQDLRGRLYRSLLDHKNPILEEEGEIAETAKSTALRTSAVPAPTNSLATPTNAPVVPTNPPAQSLPSLQQKP